MKILKDFENGIKEIEFSNFNDERGEFSRIFCENEYKLMKIPSSWSQINYSKTFSKGTIRGMHFQYFPYSEIKLIRCISGKIFDVVIDIRPKSKFYGEFFSITLDSDKNNGICIPEGFAHGFQTLTEKVTMIYFHSQPYTPNSEGGINPLDIDLGINWPIANNLISKRDKNLPAFKDLKIENELS